VGGEKGGVCKTTTALNIAAELGSRGYRVCVIDQNNKPDLTGDMIDLANKEIEVNFHLIRDENPFLPGRTLDHIQGEYDFLVCDTFQKLDDFGTEAAWRAAHLMVFPFIPKTNIQRNFRNSLNHYLEKLEAKSPCCILPCLTKPIRSRDGEGRPLQPVVMKTFYEFIQTFKSLPAVEVQDRVDIWMDDNENFSEIGTRYIHDFGNVVVTEKFLNKLSENMKWVVSVIEDYWGPLPAPQGAVSWLDQYRTYKSQIDQNFLVEFSK
jgi:hypothetical protein